MNDNCSTHTHGFTYFQVFKIAVAVHLMNSVKGTMYITLINSTIRLHSVNAVPLVPVLMCTSLWKATISLVSYHTNAIRNAGPFAFHSADLLPLTETQTGASYGQRPRVKQ